MTYWSYPDQDKQYRDAARGRGCTCPDLPAGVHFPICPLSPAGAGVYLEHLDQEHDADDGRPWL